MPLSRDFQKARQAYQHRDVQASQLAHLANSPEQHQSASGRYIKSAVYGGLDGIITTFAVVAGAAGAALGSGVVLILGFANLIADGLSMAIGDYLSTMSEQQYHTAERRREEWEVEHFPEGEKRELVELYVAKGITQEDATTIVAILAKHKQAWIDVMMIEELGIVDSNESPTRNALVTFLSFVVFGVVPLLAYVVLRWMPGLLVQGFTVASTCTAATLFTLGVLKANVTGRSKVRSGFETLFVGGVAAAAAYGVGVLLRGLA